MFGPSQQLLRSVERRSDHSPEELVAYLEPQVEPLLQRYPFVSKLSGGGVVIRVLKTPPTSRPLWGRFFGRSFHLARIPRGEDLTPWAPILHGTIHEEERGSRISIELRPHPSARTLSRVYGFFGLLLLVASIVGLQTQFATAVIGLIFGLLLVSFPGYRARYCFDRGCELALQSFDRAIGFEQAQSDDASASSTISSGKDQRA